MLTLNSCIRDLYRNPVGHDVIQKLLLQTGYSDWLIENPVVGHIKLKYLPTLTRGFIDQEFLKSALELLNSEPDVPRETAEADQPAWWKEAVFYQIYPRSFKDSNNDGIGDLKGIIEQLPYLKSLGVDALWLSPIYDSPNDDNGYDIRDYTKIMADFGTMADLDELLAAVHTSGMKLIMDLVVNHTSDEHAWFKTALNEPNSSYGDYYIFRDKPNNWTSFFSGSAWRYFKERNQYALHLFSEKQMDLNWSNPNVRGEIAEMVKGWLGKGVDGFRLDVINFISKPADLADGNEKIGKLMEYVGIEHYFYGANLHAYLKELIETAFAPYQAFSVGETPGIGQELGKLLTAPYRRELDMIFSFDQLENPGKVRWDDYRYDLNYYKKYMITWMENYTKFSQMSLFYDNHDNPRMLSKVDQDPAYRQVLAKLLAMMQLTLKGTPFIYQGQELGLIDQKFTNMNQLRDVESLNRYAQWIQTMTEAEAFQQILVGTRDHARTPMPWTSGAYGGFSEVKPWITSSDEDHLIWNAQAEAADPDSVLNFYKKLIALRKAHPGLVYGTIEITNPKTRDLFTYYRKDSNETLYIECNLSKDNLKRKKLSATGTRLLSNYSDQPDEWLRPYEAILWRMD